MCKEQRRIRWIRNRKQRQSFTISARSNWLWSRCIICAWQQLPTDEFLCVQVWLELQTATSRNCSANMWVRAWTQRRCAGPKSFAGCVHFISLCIILTCVDMCWLVGATSPFYFVASKVSVPLASLRARWLLPAHYVLVDRGRREVVVAVRGEGVELSGGEFGWMLSAALGYWCSKGI